MAITTSRAQDDNFSDELAHVAMQEQPLYDLGTILAYVQSNFEPGQIYDRGELDDWALSNGYVKAEAAS